MTDKSLISPLKIHMHPAVRKPDQLSSGERAADRMKAVLATWTALIVVLVFITAWMLTNSHVLSSGHHLDPYPWILLNLCLSCFAALQCFVLLIANKRGEQIAAEIAIHTEMNTEGIRADLTANTELTKQVEANTRLVQDVHAHIQSIADHLGVDLEPDHRTSAGTGSEPFGRPTTQAANTPAQPADVPAQTTDPSA